MMHIPHQCSSLELEFVIEGLGVQSLTDESRAMDNLELSVTNGAIPEFLRLDSYKVIFPTANTPYFSGMVNGATPGANAILQTSTDLGVIDAWQDLMTVQVNSNGSASFVDVPDPSATGSPNIFHCVKVP